MGVRKIVQIGNPVLKKNNKKVRGFKTKKTKDLIKNLKDTLRKNELFGLAGPQISKNYKIFVTEIRKTKTRPNQKDQFRVFINPEITYYSKSQSVIYEGCGSVINGQLFGPVRRSKVITIKAYDTVGQRFELKCDGLLARTILHEYDHLFGVEFTEIIEDYSKLINYDFYKKKIKNSKKQIKASKITQKSYKLLS
jgi:peptide deformylase